jgi:hypothetical protein
MYPPVMRRWLVLLMIVLLPLGGWSGAMAALAPQLPAASQHRALAAMDCAQHAASVGHHGASSQDGEPASPGCAACPLLAPGLPTAAVSATYASFRPPRPATPPARFASAEGERRFKPPIS